MALISAAVLVVSGFGTVVAATAGQQEAGLTNPCDAAGACPGQTILLVGSDARVDAQGNPLSAEALKQVATEADGGGTSTDTMMLIHIPEGGGKATAVSIPRDVWIANPPPGPSDSDASALVKYDANKVNSYYGSAKFFTQVRLVAEGVTDQPTVERESNNAGRKMLISVLENFTGIHIDNYAEVNLYGFYLLSNALGGVPVCLVNAVNDPFSGAVFPAGPQEVQGTAALSFVRQRHGLPNGDLDRVKRQQAFLSGAISKVLSVGTVTKIPELLSAADKSIVLSEGFSLLQLANQMQSMSTGNIIFATLPTHGSESSTEKDALAVDVPEVQALFASIKNETASTQGPAAQSDPAAPTQTLDPVSIIVDVQNGTITSGMAKAVSDEVAAAKYTRGQISDFPGVSEGNEQSSTTIRFSPGGEAAAAGVKAALGYGELQPDSSVDAGHVLVVVGTDRSAKPSGLRNSAPFVSAPPASLYAAPGDGSITAAQPGCVN
ncbi:LytR family transcriptional regulator [Nakamurella antarctica]|uniref:LytR family transcriptional regulator n=1 Tax=Nakamurella antarctica TaxID=1902245 RepID=A0A3G8ZP36_9ACTN|nr:LCP family protein [Nakamurella antarctica]AZI58535.1 LytR family transcriptional regulator [Nakamurella antarctica]